MKGKLSQYSLNGNTVVRLGVRVAAKSVVIVAAVVAGGHASTGP